MFFTTYSSKYKPNEKQKIILNFPHTIPFYNPHPSQRRRQNNGGLPHLNDDIHSHWNLNSTMAHYFDNQVLSEEVRGIL